MKIQFEEQQIRVRLNQDEYLKLTSQQLVSFTFEYMQFCVQLDVCNQSQLGKLDGCNLFLKLMLDDVYKLSEHKTQKEGITTLVESKYLDSLLIVTLQLDIQKSPK